MRLARPGGPWAATGASVSYGDARVRILVFNPSLPPIPCGIGQYTASVAGALSDTGHEVTVVTSAELEGAPTPGPRVRVVPALRHWAPLDYARAWPRFAQPRPDLVVSGYPSVIPGPKARLLYLLPGLAKLTLGRPRTVFVVHEFVRTGLRAQRLLALALRAADDVVCVTDAERDAVVSRHPFVARRARVVQNGSSIDAVPADPVAAAALRRLIAGDRPLVVFAGRLSSADKGFDELVDAVAGTDAVLAATGRLDPSQPVHVAVAARIERHGMCDRVRWLGNLDDGDMGHLLQAADAVAVPFRGGAEGGYTSLLAPLVAGAAVVTTSGSRTPEWLRDGDNALLVPPADPVALGAALRRVLGDQAVSPRLRAGARALRPLFGWQRVAAELADTR